MLICKPTICCNLTLSVKTSLNHLIVLLFDVAEIWVHQIAKWKLMLTSGHRKMKLKLIVLRHHLLALAAISQILSIFCCSHTYCTGSSQPHHTTGQLTD